MKLQIASNRLSLGMRGDDVGRVQKALLALGRAVPVGEGGVFGASMTAVVSALQGELGLPATGVVDAATVKAINVRLAALPTDVRVVRGVVLGADGSPFASSKGSVLVLSQVPQGEQVLGTSGLNTDGSYQMSYRPPTNGNGNGRLDIRIVVLNSGQILETTPSGASILTNAGPLEVVDFVLIGEANRPLSEFELLAADLKPHLGARDLADLTEDGKERHDVSRLASESSYPSEHVAALVLSHKLNKETGVPPPVFYGLLRQGLPSDAGALHGTDPGSRLTALRGAVDKGWVPAEIGGRKVEEFLTDLRPAPPAEVKGLLGHLLSDNELPIFVNRYLEDSQDPDAFWKRVATDPAFADRAEKLKVTVQIAGVTNTNLGLVAALQARGDVTEAAHLARLTEDDWDSLVRAPGVGVPPETPGGTDDEKVGTYVGEILARVEAAFPTRFFAARLGESPVAKFLDANPSFDLKTTRLEQFLEQTPAAAQTLPPEDRRRLHSFQRLHRLTNRTTETLALAAKGVESARQISRMDRSVFAEQHQDALPAERAAALHDKAVRANALALALIGEHGASMNRTALQALPRRDGIPNLETLFGAFDFCACSECSSAHGPAAYFVDILQFLGDRDEVRVKLFERRPDLGDIELSCENTNTPLPLIDLVNEVLENVVAPPATFAPLTIAAVLEADLEEEVATPALRAAFDPPLLPGARVEELETGKRWRVSDEPYSYSVVKENGDLKVVARSRQTTGSAAERRATPQYRNAAAYDELARSVYPGNLPFDLSSEEASVFLTHLGVSRAELIEALRPEPEPFDPSSPLAVRVAAERLGLTDTERMIVVDEPLTPLRTPEDFWGSVPADSLARVQELLDRSGLQYAELDALFATGFVNPENALAIAAEAGASVDTCDPERLRIDGLTPAALSRLHRFVRLWRRLGWSIRDLDLAIRALVPIAGAPALTDEVLVRLDHLRTLYKWLRLSVPETLALWRPIDTEEPGSLYAKLFRNPAVFKPEEEAFRLRPDGRELVHADAPLADHADALKAAFRLDAPSLALLAGRTDGTLSLASLSAIHRHATLARRLGSSVEDLLTAVDLTGLDPFRAEQSQDTLRFVEVVRAIKRSGFSVPELDYLVRHRANPAAPFVPEESTLAQTLTDILTSLSGVTADSESEKRSLQESAVIEGMASSLALPADVAGVLLGRVSHGAATAMQRLLELAEPQVQLPLSRGNVPSQFETLEKLLKIAAIIRKLALKGPQLDWLLADRDWLVKAPDPQASPVPFESWYSFVELQEIRRDLQPGDAALEAILSAINSVAAATDSPAHLAARKGFVGTLSTWLGWPQEDLQTLLGTSEDAGDLGLLSARMPDDYRGITLLARLHRAMGALKRLGVTAARASEWCETTVTAVDAKAIRSAAKAKHDEEAWQKLVAPLQNSLRDGQREALVSYLVARPDRWTSGLAKADAADLYSHFLIDVEMTSCQLTSRIKQAIGSVQLFAQRCLMGLEPGVRTDDPKWAQWSWMKNFRVWEANRKVWLYPENWIEPDLRDDKTPFFKDLESELLQADLTDAAAEQAFRNYLEKLDRVARLEIVGVYEDEDEVFHVFGRTFHTPHTVYYRQRKGAAGRPTPWEKVELDTEGNHLIPVVWNRKLMLLWPVFTEKAKPTPVVFPQPGETLASAARYWEIQLAWSEYQNGRWTGKSLSEAVPFEATMGRDDVVFGKRVGRPVNSTFLARMKNEDMEPPDLPGNGDDPETDSGGPVSNPNPTGPGPASTADLVPEELFVFKAFASEDTLLVRGFLRRDFRAAPDRGGDSRIACPFGEFRFSGCRKIVTTTPRSRLDGLSFPLAPSSTKFDRMWLTGTGGPLVMFDGTFPMGPVGLPFDPGGVQGNGAGSIVVDPGPELREKNDITVLGRAPSPYRLLAPHQDRQFVGDRGFFYMDVDRTFLVTSRGSSGKSARPDLGNWLDADLATAWRADYFPPRPPGNAGGNGGGAGPASTVLQPLTLLAPGPRGTRLVKRMVPVDLTARPSRRSLISKFWTTREYGFENFHHPYVCKFVQTLDRGGVPALLSLETQSASDPLSFDAYLPEDRVLEERPIDEVEFRSGGAYEIYNWELFFHIPLLIADRLSKNQRFEEARRWFHFIFDPTGASGGEVPQRYWRTKPFHDRLSGTYEAESAKSLERMIASGPSKELRAAIQAWRDHPFSPHAVARLRTTAYQKTVVMKYIDNLIAWGDQLFRRETLESINEATQIYVLAAEILGRRPEVIDRNLRPVVETFNSLEPRLKPGGLGNVLEQVELLVGDPGDGGSTEPSSETPDLPSDAPLYFCVPENDNLLSYWGTVADRLFKIRHCMDIQGQVRQLPLFEPPIDPALLVRAQAAGLSIGAVLQDISAALPNYRFSVMLQKANEVAAEVRNLGAALLSALEKRDGEALSTLRSGQEVRLLQAVRDVRNSQIAEAEANIAALRKSQEMAKARKDYYDGREFLSEGEEGSLGLSIASLVSLVGSAALRAVAAVVQGFGTFKIGAATTMGTDQGPAFIASGMATSASALDTGANILGVASQLAGRRAEYDRRQDEWDHQANLATIELKQIDKQLAAAEIRLAVAGQELRNHDQQVDNAREVDLFLRDKFTNQDLFQWMTGRVSGLYFQSYQLAYDLAKRAEFCMQHELGLEHGGTAFIRFGYWDSLRKGLLAGEHLAYDLKRLEVAYLDGNVREYELTKHVSLVSLAPEQLLLLKEEGSCEFEIPEWLFDLETPGHFLRRLKMVSVTIPCVTGPYTGIHGKLQLLNSSFRRNTDLALGYERPPADDTSGADDRFIDDRGVREGARDAMVVTSSAQNDAGLFEPNMRDERYLPFEGAGAVSRWRLELPTEFRAFDYNSISDVVLHLRYTAREGGGALRDAAASSVRDLLADTTAQPLLRLFSLRHEFPSGWHRFVSSPDAAINTMPVELATTRFPFFVQGRSIAIGNVEVIARTRSATPIKAAVAPGPAAPDLTLEAPNEGSPGLWTLGTDGDPQLFDDVFLIVRYTAS
jgi:Tc toxin complex TcA C-terminal TcB-binding domain/ABC toxin N-terminal region/Neuraminidase-like domain/Putative peptidoglycan binding domain